MEAPRPRSDSAGIPAFLAPAAAGLNRLRYPHKFALIGALFVLPPAVLALAAAPDLPERKLLALGAVLGLAVAVAVYLYAAFYVSLRSTVARLEDASRRMIAGNGFTSLGVENQDELGRVVRSFDAIARKLREEWAAATEEGKRALAAEAQLRESEIRTRLIVDTALDAVITMDEEGRITGWNEQAVHLFGWTAAEAVGRHLADTVLPNRHWEVLERCMRYYTATSEWPVLNKRIEIVAVRRDGGEFPAELSISPARAGERYIFSAFLRDITERKRAEDDLRQAKEEAEESNLAKSKFLANMSHELRTPLNAIIGYSEMLQEDATVAGHEPYVPDLKRIHAAGRHLLSLINDILDLSKIEAGKIELYLETFDVAAMIDDIAVTIRPVVEKNGNTLELRLAEGLGTIHGDVTRLRQVLFNLLSNAAKFSEKSVITLRAAREAAGGGERFVFEVRDAGIGMTPDQLAKLFQPFSQADASTTRKYGGSGLGLAISRRLCHLMGGDIDVTSESGKGSVFTARIPARAEPPAARTAAPPEEAGIPPHADKVLVIDDDPAVRDLLTRMLTMERYAVVAAANGVDGLQWARKIRPSAIVLDIMMPEMDGWSVLSALKADPELAEIPVIVATIVDDRNLGFTLGATDYLHKPLDRERLLSTLAKYRGAAAVPTVFIVEDDAATRRLLTQMVRGAGWDSVEAENGRVALERLAQRTPDLVLLDLMMPEMDGFSFIVEFRKTEKGRKVPVLVLTAMDLTESDRLRLQGYVEKILQKGSFRQDELLKQIRDSIKQCATDALAAKGA